MAQLFRPGANTLARLLVAGAVLGVPLLLLLAGIVARSDATTGEGRIVEQPVPFSHQHHAGELGIDCRYCHTGVEKAAFAGIPPTHTCMTCHSQLWTQAELLAPVRESMAKRQPLRWNRVNDLPDYAYFDHHVHVRNGVPCAACHGDVRRMPLTRQAAPLTMQWCVECHRDPEQRIVAPSRVYDSAPYVDRTDADRRFAHARMVALMHRSLKLTDCSVCHR